MQVIPPSVVNPARAGMIPISQGSQQLVMGKPRASGDDPNKHILSTTPTGKPRASGDDPHKPPAKTHKKTVNPARAGMIRITQMTITDFLGKPRASGDDPENERFGVHPHR